MLTGDFAEARAGRNLIDNEISYLNNIMDNTIMILINSSVSDDIKKSVKKFYDEFEHTTAPQALEFLNHTYSNMKVRIYAEFVSKHKPMIGKSIRDQVEWAEQCANYMIKFTQERPGQDNHISNVDKVAALLMFIFHPDKVNHLMSFIGKKVVVGIREVADLLKDNAPALVAVAMAAQNKRRHPKKKNGGNGCYLCGGELLTSL